MANIIIDIPDLAAAAGATSLSVSKVTIQAARPFTTLYGYLGARTILPGKIRGKMRIFMEAPMAAATQAYAESVLREGIIGSSGGERYRFTIKIWDRLKVDGCAFLKESGRSEIMAANGMPMRVWDIDISGGAPFGVSASEPWLSTGGYILPSMPDLAGVSASAERSVDGVTVPALNVGLMSPSGMPSARFTISGTLRHNSRIPSTGIPLIENAPADGNGVSSPLMEVGLGWAGYQDISRDCVNIQSSFDISSDADGLVAQVSRVFSQVPRLRDSST
jgi:hypothetical protein